jgi:hypothetical protein
MLKTVSTQTDDKMSISGDYPFKSSTEKNNSVDMNEDYEATNSIVVKSKLQQVHEEERW